MEEDTLYDKVTLPYTDITPKAGSTPLILVLLLLIFFPPAAWYVMWREKHYHSWFIYLIAFYGVLTLIGSFAIRLIFIPYTNQLYASLGLTQPAISPFSYTTIYLILGVIEIVLAIILFLVNKKNKGLPRNWLIIGLIGLAFNSLIQPITQAYLTYIAFNNFVQQSHAARPQSSAAVPTPTLTVADETPTWIEYRDEKIGYSIQYPNTWKVTSHNTSTSFRDPSDENIVLTINLNEKLNPEKYTSLIEYINKYASNETSPSRSPEIVSRLQSDSNTEGYRVQWKKSDFSHNKEMYTTFFEAPNNPDALIEIDGNEAVKEIYNRMIFTFRALK